MTTRSIDGGPWKNGVWGLLLLGVVGLSGCLRQHYFVSGTTIAEPPRTAWRHYLLWGVVDLNPDMDLRELCPQGVATIEDELEFFNVLFYVVTIGLYTSRTVDVYCQQPDESPAPVSQ